VYLLAIVIVLHKLGSVETPTCMYALYAIACRVMYVD
jgi:hypothetical protein